MAPQILGMLVRREGRFDACEDAVQEALLSASLRWREDGVPASPRGWLLTVASRRLTDEYRSDLARRRREDAVAALVPPADRVAPGPGEADTVRPSRDDTLLLLFLCCHPVLPDNARLALTLRAVCGLTTAQIAGAFLVSESTMAQRISRAKARIRSSGAVFGMPGESELADRLGAVLHVLYLLFNEGYTATSGTDLHREELTDEAVRLTRLVHALAPDDGEVTGLLALMLLTDARRPARTTAEGDLVPLAEQDRRLWDAAAVKEGVELLTGVLGRGRPGPYQLQAAIAAIHDEAADAQETDWPQILHLYTLLDAIAPGPVVTLNHAVALAMVRGPRAGLELLAELDRDERVAGGHRLAAVRAHLLEMAGEVDAALRWYRTARDRASSSPERRYLEARCGRLTRAG
ncbi:RNA polymerase subunit sigma-24 [Saccharomonospora piscinae]|uniref:RNA polymerase subunit sigma-24 n=1 Tax=Saccharomonospora piscinae TaxID=687388 RepID=A0A1V9A7X1_SACPI|nr:DUF6596 domain-containing protein [Saccharomonospora piscinae]OQO93222.1 RNA polymerase subunit sigma-24 [Saccharomonospora piscinae]